jgi:heptose-I-phosphate ethanolaminephosphotransferase
MAATATATARLQAADSGSKQETSIDWRGLGWAYLFFWYFSGLMHVLLQLGGATTSYGLRQATVASILWLIPLLLFPQRTRQISAGIGLVLWAFSLVSLGYYCVYGQEFSQSVIFIMFESNPAEAREYFSQYFVWWMVPALAIYSAIAWLLWRQIRPIHLSRRAAWIAVALIAIALFAYPQIKNINRGVLSSAMAAETIQKRMEPAVPWQMLVGYMQYQEQLAGMQVLLDQNKKLPPIMNLVEANAEQPKTLVLVIGESTNRQHMSLYGYPRQTTPKLDALRNQLTVFNKVIGPRPYTIEVLQQVLTFADQENPDLYLTTPSLMNIMKQAGYKTFWITNQQTMTKRNTMLTNFSQQADKQFYLNNNRDQNSRSYDESVLEPFQKVLADPSEKKLIIVHLLGAHMKYEYRYPPEFARFNDRASLADWATPDQVPVINNYDNAVLYNDEVVANLISSFSATNPNGLLVYFSDHGEDVFDSPGHKILGRNEGRPTEPMYAVPFFTWESESWKKQHPRDLNKFVDRPYQTSHFIHTWADLVGLRFEGFDSTKSLVSKDFRERPLWVGDPNAPKAMIDMRAMQPPRQSASKTDRS